MKKIFFCFVIAFSANFCFAQPTQAEIEKKMKAAQKEIDKMQNDPKYKDIMKNMPDMDSVRKKMTSNTILGATKTLQPGSRTLPEKNSRLLSELPKKILNKIELGNYLNTLNAQLNQKINSTSKDSVNIMVRQLDNNGKTLSSAAIVAWYKDDPEGAVLLAVKAATLSGEDNTSLNNCAAILSMSGLENKAIPILQVLLEREPASSTVLNNLGQAFAGLGELDTAMYYFGRCIKLAPTHPEANTTAAMICVKRGQAEAAKKYCKQALQVALTGEAVRTYQSLFKEDDIYKFVDEKPFKSYPFNEHDFKFPLQCEKVADAISVKSEVDAYKALYRDMKDKWTKGEYEENMQKMQSKVNQFSRDPTNNLDKVNSQTPLSRRAGYALYKITQPLIDEQYKVIFKRGDEAGKLKLEYNKKRDTLRKKHDEEFDACNQDNLCWVKLSAKYCRLYNELSDEYLPKFAVINRDYVSKRWRIAKEMFEAYSVYSRIALRHGSAQWFAAEGTRTGFIFGPLASGEILSDGYEIMMPNCDLTDAEMKRIDSLKLNENKNCDINIEIPLEVAKFTITCDEFEIEGGEGIKAKYNKNFRTGQTTLYAGVGGSAHIPGFEAGATQYVFICFDKNNQPVDAGTQGELELDVKGMVKADQKIILKTSINTGISLEPGPLSGLINVLPYAFK